MPYKTKYKKITLTAGLLFLGVISIFLFVISNARDLLFGSPLAVHTAKDGATLTDGFLPIEGKARHARSIAVNGRPLFIDREGNFADGVILSPGYNVVQVSLLDQFGKQKTKTYHLVLDETDTVAQARGEKLNYQQ